MLLYHLINLPETSLARDVLILHTENSLPGFSKNVKFLSDLSLYFFTFNAGVKENNKLKLAEMVKNKQYKKTEINKLGLS